MTLALHDVAVAPLALERFGEVLDEPAYADLMEFAQRARPARARVREKFLEPRHLRQWFDVVQRIERT